MKKIKYISRLVLLLIITSCSHYLNVVPDGVADLEMMFNNRTSAERYLTTCYSYIPLFGAQRDNPGLTSGNDIWYYTLRDQYNDNEWAFGIANGLQNTQDPLTNYWDGGNGAKSMFKAIRDCNIFLEYVSDESRVAGLDIMERKRWLSEVTVLKAFYNYHLFQLYGPIPIVDKNLPVSASPEEVRIKRAKVDEVVNYIVDLIDNSYTDLPKYISKSAVEDGRLTQAAALSIKAKVLLLAASPLFNGNTDYANFLDHDKEPFFNQNYDQSKWTRAAEACKMALESAINDQRRQLYDFKRDGKLAVTNDSIVYMMNSRQALTERFNVELVWGCGTQYTGDLQNVSQPRLNPGTKGASDGTNQYNCKSIYAPTMEIAEMFYTRRGVPMEEDKEWNENGWYDDRYTAFEKTTENDKYYMKVDFDAPLLHLRREARFYGALGFDGSTWYGQGWTIPDDASTRNYVEGKQGEFSGQKLTTQYSITGYYAKKLIYYGNIISNNVVINEYPFPIVRLADLYLMYAEALLESVSGDSDIPEEIYDCLRVIRERSGLKKSDKEPIDIGDVREAWKAYSINPEKATTKAGLREIIRRERQVELALEGQRYYDIRRWKLASKEFNKPVRGWNVGESTTEDFYRIRYIYNQKFYQRDYLWPIKEQSLIVNTNLIQNPGW